MHGAKLNHKDEEGKQMIWLKVWMYKRRIDMEWIDKKTSFRMLLTWFFFRDEINMWHTCTFITLSHANPKPFHTCLF
jgi:hypothetical protein